MNLNLHHSPVCEQIQGSRAAASTVSASKFDSARTEDNPFMMLMKTVMSSEVIGSGGGEISRVYGTLLSSPRLDASKFNLRELSQSARVKAIKEEYNEEESRNFAWMMSEAKKLKKMLAKFEEVLGNG